MKIASDCQLHIETSYVKNLHMLPFKEKEMCAHPCLKFVTMAKVLNYNHMAMA